MCNILKRPNNAKNTRKIKRLLITDNKQILKISNSCFISPPSFFNIIIEILVKIKHFPIYRY